MKSVLNPLLCFLLTAVLLTPAVHAQSTVAPQAGTTVRSDDPLAGVGELIFAGRAEEARTQLLAAMETYRRQSDAQNEAICFLLLGLADVALADATAARTHLEHGAERLAALGDGFGSWLALWMLAELEKREGRFAEAISLHERALTLLHDTESSSEPFSLEGLKSLAPIFGMPVDDLGPLASQPQVVKPILLRLAELISKDSHGGVLVEAGQLEKAEVELAQASGLSSMFGGLFDASLAAHVGDLRRRQWRFDEARASYQKALDAVKLLPAVPFRDEWVEVKILGNLAELELLSGRYDEALAWNEKALQLVRSRGNQPREASILQERANLLLRSSRFAAAEPVFAAALRLAEQSRDIYRQASIVADIGVLNMLRGNYGTAAADFERSIELFQTLSKPDVESQVWALLSEVYLLLDDHGSAGTTLEKARELAKKSGFPLAQAMVEMLSASDKFLSGKNSVSDLEKYFGAWWELPEAGGLMFSEDVQQLFKEVIGLRAGSADNGSSTPSPNPEAIAGSGLPVLPVMARLLQGKVLFQRGEIAAAREVWRKAVEENPSKDLRAGFLAAIGATYWREGKAEEAIRYFTQAVEALEQAFDDVRVEEMLAGYLGSERRWYFEILIELLVRQGRSEEAFDFAERARARAFLQLLGNRRLQPARGADEQLVREAEGLRTQILDWERRSMFVLPPERARIVADLQQARQRFQSLWIRLKSSNPEYASLTKVEPLQIQAVREDLPADTTLISYFVSSLGVHAWVLDRESLQHVSLPLASGDLLRAVCWADQFGPPREFRGVKVRDPKCGSDRASSEEIFDKLIAPLRDKIRNPRLALIPHGVLHYLPFAALRDPKTGHYLIEDYTLTYAPSASALRFLRAKETPVTGKALVLGDPDTELRPLPGAVREATLVARDLGTAALLGPQAAKSLLYHLKGQVDLLHIAAHGIYNPDSPLFSHIALAPGSSQDGDLEVHEILADLDLSGVNLVVLSACQTAIGERSGGDEIVGLTRAILYAGSPGVISTLWDIDDEAAAVLMEEFYHRLLDGASAAEALRQAQLALLRSPQYGDPSFWAAFSLAGDPQGRWQAPAATTAPSLKED